MTRGVRWIVLVGIAVVLLATYLLAVPFRTVDFFINRRTGAWSPSVITYFGVITLHRDAATATRGNPVGKGPLTAKERLIPVARRTQRYFWSGESTLKNSDPDIWFAEAAYQMFFFAAFERAGAKKLTDDELDSIIRSRLPFWNSSELDRDPRSYAEAARAENAEILGVPVGRSFE
jgi:hypothetical protein